MIAVWDWEREPLPEARVVVCRAGVFDNTAPMGPDRRRRVLDALRILCSEEKRRRKFIISAAKWNDGDWLDMAIPALYAERQADLSGAECEACRKHRRYPEVQEFKNGRGLCSACRESGRIGGIASLLSVKAERRALVLSPREEIDLTAYPYPPIEHVALVVIIPPPEARTCSACNGRGWSWCAGGDDSLSCAGCLGNGRVEPWPMHPAWVRGIVEQCRTAGVPVCFLGWGAWKPMSECVPGDERFEHQYVWRAGADNPNDLPISSYRTGAGRAGRTLDDDEVMEIPEWLRRCGSSDQ